MKYFLLESADLSKPKLFMEVCLVQRDVRLGRFLRSSMEFLLRGRDPKKHTVVRACGVSGEENSNPCFESGKAVT